MADPPFLDPASNRYGRFMEDDMETDDGTGEKNDEKGVETKVGGKIVNVVASTGDSDDLDGNRALGEVQGDCEGIDGIRDTSDGQDLTELGHAAKEARLDTTAATSTTSTTTGYDGEPTENDVVERFDGSVAWKDRSLGGEFVAVENKKSGSKGIVTTASAAVAAMVTTKRSRRFRQWIL
jgi:hypothetical protein